MAFLDPLSAATGVPEPSLRLLLTILAGLPLALGYRLLLDTPSSAPQHSSKHMPALRNLYLVVTGLSASYFFNGTDIIHSLVTVLACYLICAVVGGLLGNRKLAAALCWIVNAAYLLGGYHFTAADDYDISWTMSQCVLCLRLMGFAMDYYDGAHVKKTPAPTHTTAAAAAVPGTTAHKAGDPTNRTELNRKTKYPVSFDVDTPLADLPPLLEVLGYTYFFGAFLIGPQFSFSLYKKFLHGKHLPQKEVPSGRTRYALRCILVGALYLAITQIGAMFFSTAFLSTKEFAAKPLLSKLVIMWFTGKLALNKYLGVWVLNEASCVIAGISFSGFDDKHNGIWDGLCNIDVRTYETATSLNHVVASFNMNTNNWVKNYVFKRLRFLGNKHLSSLGTLMFLAIWHGTHIGYFTTFLLEFVDVEGERRLKNMVRPWLESRVKSKLRGPLLTVIDALDNAVCWLLTTSALYYAACQFDALQWSQIRIFLGATHWTGHWILLAIYLASFVHPMVFPKRSPRDKVAAGKQGTPIQQKKEL